MTRINYGILPEQLIDQHLKAELRELPRIPRKVKRFLLEGKHVNTTNEPFCLGTGHVTFFHNKLRYLHERYDHLYKVACKRGFNIQYDPELFFIPNNPQLDQIFVKKFYNVKPIGVTEEGTNLVKARIRDRILESNQTPRYNREDIDKKEYILKILKYRL